jgi:hypothetical protein
MPKGDHHSASKILYSSTMPTSLYNEERSLSSAHIKETPNQQNVEWDIARHQSKLFSSGKENGECFTIPHLSFNNK